MKKIIISLTLAAFVAAPMESIAQNIQNQSKSLFDVMMRHQQENKDKKTSDKKTIAKGKTTVKKNMTNRERANILYPLLNNMVKMKGGTIYQHQPPRRHQPRVCRCHRHLAQHIGSRRSGSGQQQPAAALHQVYDAGHRPRRTQWRHRKARIAGRGELRKEQQLSVHVEQQPHLLRLSRLLGEGHTEEKRPRPLRRKDKLTIETLLTKTILL